MKKIKIVTALMLSVFCISGCSKVNEIKGTSEQTTTAVSEVMEEEFIDETPDMSEKWEMVNAGEEYSFNGDGTEYDAYGFTNESGYQFSCDVFLPESAKTGGEKCPAILMSNGFVREKVFDEVGNHVSTSLCASYYPVELLAAGLNKEGIALIVIEPFESMAVYNAFLNMANAALENTADFSVKGYEKDNTFTAEKAMIDIVLDHIQDISGVKDSGIILASSGFHNIAATQSAVKHQDKISGLVMLDPAAHLSDKIRLKYKDKEDLKDISYKKADKEYDLSGLDSNYMYDLYDIDLSLECSKLSCSSKIFISKENINADTSDPKYDKGMLNGTWLTAEEAEKYYKGSAPELVETTDLSYIYNPPAAKTDSVKKIVSYCKQFFEKG